MNGMIVLIVAVMAAFVSLSRPRTGGHILTFACLAVAAVVSYSIHLSFSEDLQGKFIGSPIANTAPHVPGRISPFASVKASFESSPMHSKRRGR